MYKDGKVNVVYDSCQQAVTVFPEDRPFLH